MASPAHRVTRDAQPAGLGHWMGKVLEEFDRVGRDFDPDAVHDLRTAFRRCRTMAQTLRQLDPDSDWKKAMQASRKLFQSLGELRDLQVARQWAIDLAPETDSFRQKLWRCWRPKNRRPNLASNAPSIDSIAKPGENGRARCRNGPGECPARVWPFHIWLSSGGRKLPISSGGRSAAAARFPGTTCASRLRSSAILSKTFFPSATRRGARTSRSFRRSWAMCTIWVCYGSRCERPEYPRTPPHGICGRAELGPSAKNGSANTAN